VLRSTYCTAAHRLVLAEKWPEATPDGVDVAVMDLAEKVARDASSVEQRDIDRLRDLGLTDAEVFDVVAAAALRSFFAKTLDGVGAQCAAQFAQRLDAATLDAVTVGRPFASVGE
jgi:alkylhydroperoxidase family enzyme